MTAYAPFPERELEALALENDEASAKFAVLPRWRDHYAKRAEMLRNAVECHEALRERCLLAELKLTQIKRVADVA